MPGLDGGVDRLDYAVLVVATGAASGGFLPIKSSARLILVKADPPALSIHNSMYPASRPFREETAMSYSTLMVHLDLDRSNEARLQMAGELAERFDSRLIGIAAADIQPLYFMEGVEAQHLLEKDRARLKSQMADCEAQFRRVLKARADNIEWRSALDWPTDFVARMPAPPT